MQNPTFVCKYVLKDLHISESEISKPYYQTVWEFYPQTRAI